MTDRIPLDHLNSDQYDELCDQLDALRQVARGYRPDCGRGDAAPTVTDWEIERRRAVLLADTLREVLAQTPALSVAKADLARWRAVLAEDQPGPAATQATERDCLFRRDGCRPCLTSDRCATCDTAPLTPTEEARLAQDGVDTPGCDCGHDGMGVSWHSDDCPWRRSVVDCPGRPTPG